tara:strand:- start:156 stop:281 length:126 start_codon:yes stop_codon:yes gene_type:complete
MKIIKHKIVMGVPISIGAKRAIAPWPISIPFLRLKQQLIKK